MIAHAEAEFFPAQYGGRDAVKGGPSVVIMYIALPARSQRPSFAIDAAGSQSIPTDSRSLQLNRCCPTCQTELYPN